MSDAHDRETSETEVEREETEVTETEVDEVETDGDGEADTELAEEASDDGDEQSTEPRRETRGQPSREHRDNRVKRREEFEREVDRAVERRLSRLGSQQNRPDPLAQRRELEQRRNVELDTARLEGPEKYADVLSRHTREDLEARANAFGIQQLEDRNQRTFDRLCSRNPVYDSVRDDVEQRVDELRARGVPAPDREIIAKVILGERYAERAGKQGRQQRTHADRETRRQTVRSSSDTRSQQPAVRRRGNQNFADLSVEEMERRLSNEPIRTQ